MSDKKASKKAKYNALIVGAGNIGAGYDTPESGDILTHAHAYMEHQDTALVGFVDFNKETGIRAANTWQTGFFSSLGKAFEQESIDIVSICTPTTTHAEILRTVLPFGPKLVICEKPMTSDTIEGEHIAEEYKASGIPLLVNYSRRFSHDIASLGKQIKAGEFGRMQNVRCIYTKGLHNNGSHMVDLLRVFCGELTPKTLLASLEDHIPGDLSVAAFLVSNTCDQIYLTIGDARTCSVFEMDILFEKGRIQLLDSGNRICIQRCEEDSQYPGYVTLVSSKVIETDIKYACQHMVENAVAHIDNSTAPLLCSAQEALATQRTLDRLCAL